VKRMRFLSAGALAVACAVALGCAGVNDGPEQSLSFHAIGVAFLEGEEQGIGVPAINWDTTVEATGHGFPAANAATAGQKEATALEAAMRVGQARLLEKIHGVHVAQQSEVRDMTYAGDKIQAQLAGDLTGVKVVKRSYDAEKGIAEVTLMVGLDSKGNIVPDRMLPITPLSVAVRRARAEQAACIDALAKLREQIGEVEVGQEIKVKNLQLSHQRAWLVVEGILEGVKFEEPLWASDTECRVEAHVGLTPAQYEQLRAMAGPVR